MCGYASGAPFSANWTSEAGLFERKFSGRKLCSSKKRNFAVGKTRKGKGTKWMVVADGKGIPLGSQLASARAAEVKLAETTLEQISVPRGGPGRPLKRPKAGDRRHGLR